MHICFNDQRYVIKKTVIFSGLNKFRKGATIPQQVGKIKKMLILESKLGSSTFHRN